MKNNNLVFVIEDEEDLGQLMCSALENFRYEVRYFSNGVDALVAAPKENPDICIVDLNLPDMDGLELVKQFDAQQRGVIIVSGRDDLTDRVLGLEFGADDYITKPFEPRELVARVQSLLRRLQRSAEAEVVTCKKAEFAGWTYRPESLELQYTGQKKQSLSRAEGDMLLALLKHPFQILSRDQLLGDNCTPYDRSIDVRMSRLRKKLESSSEESELIKTVYGAGYMLTTAVNWS
ncbi:response regulator transcription factor [Pontibacterium sp.]|uniref:response regulator transcription factor n=1 Tax=Pontibacterium sp. TaxID=2036026 RepID=UPI003517CF7B